MLNKCEKCALSTLNCICNKIPKLKSNVEFCLLTHERELNRPTNTGGLIKMALPYNTFIYQWKRKEPPAELIKKINSEENEVILIYPTSNSAKVIETDNIINSKKKIIFILIDGTWQESRKIMAKSSYLTDIPVLGFKPKKKSKFILRRNIDDSHLCTIETSIEVLRLVKEYKNAEALDNYFDNYIKYYLADKSGHSFK